MFKIKTIDATRGAMIPQIILFTVPLILTTLIQTLFNAVDIAVLGNMADTRAVAAVGTTTTIVHLIVDVFVGISSGAALWAALRRNWTFPPAPQRPPSRVATMRLWPMQPFRSWAIPLQRSTPH